MNRKLTPDEINAFTRQDLATFIYRVFQHLHAGASMDPNWHIELLANKLDDVRLGKIRRLIINVPPRHGKSICASVAFPAFLLGHDPSKQIICVSYAQELADKLSRDCRNVMKSPWYQSAFVETRLAERVAVGEFMTTSRGVRIATSIGGVLTGRGADVIIIDDPLKPDDAMSDSSRLHVNIWYDGTLISRLNSKVSGAIVVVMQRLHIDDLTGHLLKQGGWEVVSLPAIAEQDEVHHIKSIFGVETKVRKTGEALHPAREPLSTLAETKAIMGPYNFEAQYQQRPSAIGGGILKSTWFGRYTLSELPQKFDAIIQSWDTASKVAELNDYSCCVTIGVTKTRYYVLDVCRKRLEFPDLKREVLFLANRWKPTAVLIEDHASGTSLIQELRRENLRNIKPVKPSGTKVMRAIGEAATLEAGQVLLPAEAHWMDEFLREIEGFPTGRFDDQVDALVQALNWQKTIGSEPPMLTFYRKKAEEQARLEKARFPNG